jgi:hypothetical protein
MSAEQLIGKVRQAIEEVMADEEKYFPPMSDSERFARAAIHAIVGDPNDSRRIDTFKNYGHFIDLHCPRCDGRLCVSIPQVLTSTADDIASHHAVPDFD